MTPRQQDMDTLMKTGWVFRILVIKMSDIYEHTALTPLRVAHSSGYIDWASQPSIFKQYPGFLYRYPLSTNEALTAVKLSRVITSKQQIGSKPYYQLNTPSAGNLHPLELYVQIRGIKGVISGIYHVDVLQDSLVLIREIEKDGIEFSVGLNEKFNGMIFILSIVPYRSEWKYGDRGLRYAYLDVGHQIGAIQASAYSQGRKVTILSEFDTNCLDAQMGFLNQEFSCAVLAMGFATNKPVEKIKLPLMEVAPTDYCEAKGYITEQIPSQDVYSTLVKNNHFLVNEKAILQRRSARKFSRNMIPKAKLEHFMHLTTKITSSQSWHVVVLQDDCIDAGVYKKGELSKSGQFSKEITALLVNQSFLGSASMIVVITSEQFNANELMNASVSAHEIHLEAQMMDLGFTGIGAFYDKRLQSFLQTKEYILYVCAIGSND